MSADTKIPSLSSQVKSLQPAIQWARRVADQINMVSPIRGGPGVNVSMVPGVGTTIGVDPVKRGRRILGIIVATGPGGAPDYTDARYWWQEAYLHQYITENVTSEARPEVDDAAANASAQTLTNLTEVAGSTHTLTPGTFVWVDAVEGRIDSGTVNQFYQFTTLTSPPSNGGISFLITGNATGAGKYVGKTFTAPPAGVDPASDLASGDFGTLAGSANALILNPPELAMSNTGHDVNSTYNAFSLYGCGSLLCVNSDGTLVIVAQMFYAGCA